MEQVIMRPFSTTTYSLKEVSEKLRCSDTKVGRLVALGLIRPLRLGEMRITDIEYDRFVQYMTENQLDLKEVLGLKIAEIKGKSEEEIANLIHKKGTVTAWMNLSALS